MPAPPIPGFFYDEERKKYFKITNGSLANQASSKYHNNSIQNKRRYEDSISGEVATSAARSRSSNAVCPENLVAAKSEKCRLWVINAVQLKSRFRKDDGIFNILCGNSSVSSFYNAGDSIDYLKLKPGRAVEPNTVLSHTSRPYIRDSHFIFEDAFFRNIREDNEDLICNWSRNAYLHHVFKHQLTEDPSSLMLASISMSNEHKSFSILRIFYNGEDTGAHLLRYIRDREKYSRGGVKHTLRLLFGSEHFQVDDSQLNSRIAGDLHSKIAMANKHLNLLNSGNLATDQRHESNEILESFLSDQSITGADGFSCVFEYNAHAANQTSHIVSISISDTDIYFLGSESDLIRVGYKIDNHKINFDSLSSAKLPIRGTHDFSEIAIEGPSVLVTTQKHLILVKQSELKRPLPHISRSSIIPLPDIPRMFHVVNANTVLIAFLRSIEMLRINYDNKGHCSAGNTLTEGMLSFQKLAPLFSNNGGRRCMNLIGHNLIANEGSGMFRIVNLRRTPLLGGNTTVIQAKCDLNDICEYEVIDIVPVSTNTEAFGVLYRNKTKVHYAEYNL